MKLFVECRPDEALAYALGVRREVQHALHRSGVCARVSQTYDATGMVDEDPNSAPQQYMKTLGEQSSEHGVRVLHDSRRNNRLVVICPRLEEWLVQSAKQQGLKMTDFGFESDNGLHLHREINDRLENVKKLAQALRSAKSPRILRLQSLIKQT